MSTIRGHSLLTINDWLAQRFNNDYAAFLSGMRAPVAATLHDAQVWDRYPVEYLAEIYQNICTRLSNGTSQARILDDLGSFWAKTDISEESPTNLQAMPTTKVFNRLPSLWSRYKDCGDLQVLKINEDESYAELMLSGCACGPLHFDVTSAWIEGVLISLCNRKFKINGQFYPSDSYYWKITWR